MNNKKTLIVDCDGVLYPSSQLSLRQFVSAMKETYRNDMKVSGEIQSQVSAETIAKKQLGMFNYIKAMCEKVNYSFPHFCYQMFEKVDYGNIERDDSLFRMLQAAARQDEVIIFTNNHNVHLDKVLRQRFDKSIFEAEEAGIRCYDITMTEKNGVFQPKQDPKALLLFAKRIERRPQDCILIDDSPRNIEAARQVGMGAELIAGDNTLKAYFSKNYIFNINQVSGRENG